MTRTKAVREILNNINYGGLPRAIEIYDYLSGYNTIVVTTEIIANYFRR